MNPCMKNSCLTCNKTTELSCSKCRAVFCQKKCAAVGWENHKKNCVKIPDLSKMKEDEETTTASQQDTQANDHIVIKSAPMPMTSSSSSNYIPKVTITKESFLPLNETNKVIVNSINFEKETDFSIVLEKNAEIIAQNIRSIETKQKLSSSKVKKDELALVYHEDMGYRVKILKVVKKRNVEVVFIDSGCEGVIKMNELKMLPHPLDQIPPLRPVQVRLVSGTIISESINAGDEALLTAIDIDTDSIPRVILEKDKSMEALLEKLNLGETLANKFDGLCELGLIRFPQLRNREDHSSGTTDDQPLNTSDENENAVSTATPDSNPGNEEETEGSENMEGMLLRILELKKRINVTKIVLMATGKTSSIEEIQFSNLLGFSLHSLALVYEAIEYQHIMNMLLASTFGEKIVETGIDYQTLKDFRTIMKWKLKTENSYRIDSEKFKLLVSFINFFNERLFCDDDDLDPIHDASAVMLDFINISPFEPCTNKRIALLLFNIILRKHKFPLITFPVEKDERFNQVLDHATTSADYTGISGYLKFVYQCCVDSLVFYAEKLTKELPQKKHE